MGAGMKANGLTISNMDKGTLHGRMAVNTQVSTFRTSAMVKVFSPGLMDASIEVDGNRVANTALQPTRKQTGKLNVENGRKVCEWAIGSKL